MNPDVLEFFKVLRHYLSAEEFARFMALVKVEAHLPAEYHLSQNYPNPFNPETEIEFGLPEATKVNLTVYNALGQVMDVLIDSELQAGYHTVTWSGQGAASGIYFYRFTAGGTSRQSRGEFSNTKRMLLLK